MTWWEQPFTAFDVETTGTDVMADRLVTAALYLKGGATRSILINPGVDIPEEAAKVHGITTEVAQAQGVLAVDAIAWVVEALYQAWAVGPVVVFNAAFDLSIAAAELRRHHDMDLHVQGPVIDPFVIDRHIDKYRKGKRTLTAMCDHYQVTHDGAHDAAHDAVAAARLAWRLGQHPQIVGMTVEDLHTAQIGWHADRQEDYARYLARKGEDVSDVQTEWPLRSA